MMGEKEARNKSVKQEIMETNSDQREKHEHELGHRKRKSITDHAFNPLFKEKRKSITAADEELERPKRLPEVGNKRNFVRDNVSFAMGKATNICAPEAVSLSASEGQRRDSEENRVTFSKRENHDPVKKENEANLIDSELEQSKAHNKIEMVQCFCEYRMSVLVEKQREDMQKFISSWEQKRVALEKKHNVPSHRTSSEHRHPIWTIKLEILDKEFDNEMEQFKQEMEKSLKEFEENQLASRNEESQKAARWLRRAKLSANEERVHTEIPLHGSQNGNQCLAPLEGNNRNNQSNSEQERDSSSILSGKEQLKKPKYTRTVESISEAIKKFNKKCDKRMRRLVQRHKKEIQELNELWDQKWVIFEKSHEQNPAVNNSMQRFSERIDNLDALNSGFANHMKEEYQHQKEILLKELEQKQLTEKNEECQKATHWITILESELKLARKDRANGEPSLVGTIKCETVVANTTSENDSAIISSKEVPVNRVELSNTNRETNSSPVSANLIQDDYINAEKVKVPPPEPIEREIEDVEESNEEILIGCNAVRKESDVANSIIPPGNSPSRGHSPKICSPNQPVESAICDLPLPHNLEIQNKLSQPLSCNFSRDENALSCQKLSLQVEVLSPEVVSTVQQVVENQTDLHQATRLVHETPSGGRKTLPHYTDPPLYVAKDKSDFSHCGVEQIGRNLERPHPLLVSESPLGPTPEKSSSQDTVILPQDVELTADTLILPRTLETQNKFSQPLSCNVSRDENAQTCQKLSLQVEVLSPEVESTVQQVVENQTDLNQATGLVHETSSGGRTNLPNYTDPPIYVAKDKSDFSHCGVEQIGRNLERSHPLLVSETPLRPTPEKSSSQDAMILPQAEELTADTLIHSILQSEPNLSCQDSNDYDQVTKEREYLKLMLERVRGKEIEETSAKIKSNYESNRQDVETNCLLKKNEIETKQNKVILNDELSEAFRSTHLNPSLLPTVRMQQVVNLSFLHLLHQLPPLDLVPKPSSIAEPPSSGIPSSSLQVSVRPPPPRLQVSHQSTGHFSTRPTRPLTITSITPVRGNTGVSRSNVRAPAPHIRHFRPPAQTTVSDSSRPPSPPLWSHHPQNIYPTSVSPPSSWSTPPYFGPQSQGVQANLAGISHSPPLGSSPPPQPPHSLPVTTNQTSVFHRQQPETAGVSTPTSNFTDLSALRFLVDMDNL